MKNLDVSKEDLNKKKWDDLLRDRCTQCNIVVDFYEVDNWGRCKKCQES